MKERHQILKEKMGLTYFGLQWPPKICPFPAFSFFLAGFRFDQNRNSEKQDEEENLKPIFRIFPLLFRKLVLQGVYHCEHIPKFYQENRLQFFYKIVRRCILLQVIQRRKKSIRHGLHFPTKSKSLNYKMYIKCNFSQWTDHK